MNQRQVDGAAHSLACTAHSKTNTGFVGLLPVLMVAIVRLRFSLVVPIDETETRGFSAASWFK